MLKRTPVVVAVGLVLLVAPARASQQPPAARTSLPAVYAQAQAERGRDALAKVQSIHIVFVVDHVASGRVNGPGGGLPTSADAEPLSEIAQVWLAPPQRFLQTLSVVGSGFGEHRIGVDGARVIGPSVGAFAGAERRELMRFALALLMADPASLSITLTDLGQAAVDGHRYSGIHATGPDGFDCLLMFDNEHRLAVTEENGVTVSGYASFRSGQKTQESVSPPRTAAVRQVYSDFKRVDGIELPFTIAESVEGGLAQIWHVSKVEMNPKDLDKAFK